MLGWEALLYNNKPAEAKKLLKEILDLADADSWRYADAAVVGSAIVSEIERNLHSPDVVKTVGDYVVELVPPFAKTLVET